MLILSQMVLMLDILEMFLNFHYLTYIRIDENANSEQRQVRRKAFPWFWLAAQCCPPEPSLRALGSQSCVRGAVFGPSERGRVCVTSWGSSRSAVHVSCYWGVRSPWCTVACRPCEGVRTWARLP